MLKVSNDSNITIYPKKEVKQPQQPDIPKTVMPSEEQSRMKKEDIDAYKKMNHDCLGTPKLDVKTRLELFKEDPEFADYMTRD